MSRILEVPLADLAAWPGARAFRFDLESGELAEVLPPPGPAGVPTLAEAPVTSDAGSWWAPLTTEATAPDGWMGGAWGPLVPVRFSGPDRARAEIAAGGSAARRPACLVYWTPAEVLAAHAPPFLAFDAELVGRLPFAPPPPPYGPLPPGVTVQVEGSDLVVTFATQEDVMPLRVESPSYRVRIVPDGSTQ